MHGLAFTGEYDLFGKPVFREGRLLAESVCRCNDQSARALMFIEIDFENMSDRALLQVLDRM